MFAAWRARISAQIATTTTKEGATDRINYESIVTER